MYVCIYIYIHTHTYTCARPPSGGAPREAMGGSSHARAADSIIIIIIVIIVIINVNVVNMIDNIVATYYVLLIHVNRLSIYIYIYDTLSLYI